MDKINITEELSQNFIDFSYEANSCRAFADARDGLKPGQRACLWEMYKNGYLSNKPHVKSAKISGGVISSWWPHGNTAIYETFARMSQDWINNIPEVDWHGGNGSQIISAEPSADRYTEARLSKAAEDGLMYGLKKKNVPMILNFSEDAEWPEVLPAIFPRLLVNGCQGIGLTISNTWLPHSLSEVSRVICEYLETGELNIKDLAPDFPTGGVIINKNDLYKIYTEGKGKAVVRAKVEIKGNAISILELPYQVYVEPLIDDIKKLIVSGEFDEIEEINNKSDKTRLLIEIISSNPSVTLDKLYQKTDLQKSYHANQWALISKTPKLLNLQQYLDVYVNHNIECIKREYQFDYDKAKARLEIISGLLKALEDIDNIIALIKASRSAEDAKQNLINKYSLSIAQATAIVEMKLGKLANLERIELEKEAKELEEKIEKIEKILSSKSNQIKIFKDRLTTFTGKFGRPRRTQLAQIEVPVVDNIKKPAIEEKECLVTVNKKGNIIVRSDTNNSKEQNRNINVFSRKMSTLDNLFVFSSAGKTYKIPVSSIPEGKGSPITTLVGFEPNETPLYYSPISDKKFIVFATKKGLVKKVPLSEYIGMKRKVLKATKIKDGDSVVGVTSINQEKIMLITRKGFSIFFNSSDLPISSRISVGVKGIELEQDDEVVALLVSEDSSGYLAIATISGLGKRVSLEEFPVQGRAGKGVICTKRKVTGAAIVGKKTELIVNGTRLIKAEALPVLSRDAEGNEILKSGEAVTAIEIKE